MAPPGETERLVFATWTDADADAAWSLWGDARVTRLIAAVPWTREQVDARLATEMGMQLEHGVSYWPMFLRADRSELVGCCGLRPYCGGAAGGGAFGGAEQGGLGHGGAAFFRRHGASAD